jgi:hypothetical protein
MCILPNFKAEDLETLKRNGKRGVKKETETVELIVTEPQLKIKFSGCLPENP